MNLSINKRRLRNAILIAFFVGLILWLMTGINTEEGFNGEMAIAFFQAGVIGTFVLYYLIVWGIGFLGRSGD